MKTPHDIEQSAIDSHLAISQSIIQRMATNSASCKSWCITIVAALLVVVADKGKPALAIVALVPTALFFALDVYYLWLESRFRQSYNGFIGKLHSGKVEFSDVYAMSPSEAKLDDFLKCAISFSIWPFYGFLTAMVLFTREILN